MHQAYQKLPVNPFPAYLAYWEWTMQWWWPSISRISIVSLADIYTHVSKFLFFDQSSDELVLLPSLLLPTLESSTTAFLFLPVFLFMPSGRHTLAPEGKLWAWAICSTSKWGNPIFASCTLSNLLHDMQAPEETLHVLAPGRVIWLTTWKVVITVAMAMEPLQMFRGQAWGAKNLAVLIRRFSMSSWKTSAELKSG